MTRTKRTAFIAIAAGAVLAMATPALAFNWSCMARDRAGHEYEGKSFGLFSPWVKQIATDRAMEKCEEAGGKSCTLKDCVDLDVQPRT
jgi:hypothetical protein